MINLETGVYKYAESFWTGWGSRFSKWKTWDLWTDGYNWQEQSVEMNVIYGLSRPRLTQHFIWQSEPCVLQNVLG